MKKQSGFLMMTLLLLVVVIGFLTVIVSQLVVSETSASLNQLLARQAFHTAESGLNIARYRLLSPEAVNSSFRLSCSDLSTTSGLINGNQYSLSSVRFYSDDPVDLAQDITATETIIPANTTNGNWNTYNHNGPGRIMIDKEMMDYTKTSTSDLECGVSNAPCFYGVKRGTGNTTATDHTAGRSILTNMCQITTTGYSGALSTPLAKTIMRSTAATLEEGFVLGSDVGLQWDGKNWVSWINLPAITYLDTEMLTPNDIWAVGADKKDPAIYHWNGQTWSEYTLPIPNPSKGYTVSTLNSISCLSTDNCIAVGDAMQTTTKSSTTKKDKPSKPSTKTTDSFIFQWDGTTWNLIDLKSIGLTFYAVANTSNFYFAIGTDGKKSYIEEVSDAGKISSETQLNSEPYTSVACPTSQYCLAVGNGGIATFWDGYKWSSDDPGATNANLANVSCTTPDDCWIVSDDRNTILHRAGEGQYSMLSNNPTGTALNAIQCSGENNCWAVGDNGAMAHFDGTTWATIPAVTNNDLYTIQFISDPSQTLLGFQQI